MEEPGARHELIGAEESARANRAWWNRCAGQYQAEHGEFLGDATFVWGPEGLDEADAGLLGDVRGAAILELGCGAGQCGRWLTERGARVVGVDISAAQLAHSRRIDARRGTGRLPVAVADARRLPFADASFDIVCSAYGALPFVADSATVFAETARVLAGGGRFAFSLTHPIRWCFPDQPDHRGLVACHSYFDRTPYTERATDGTPIYAEHHRTLGDLVRQLTATGFRLLDLVEPEWPADLETSWDAWSPLRGRIIPGTAIFVCDRSTGTNVRELSLPR